MKGKTVRVRTFFRCSHATRDFALFWTEEEKCLIAPLDRPLFLLRRSLSEMEVCDWNNAFQKNQKDFFF